MPINLNRYPPNWKQIRERTIKRAGQVKEGKEVIKQAKCEFCNVENKKNVFRGFIQYKGETKEIYQDGEANIYDAKNSEYLLTDIWIDINPLNKKKDAKATKIVLTIAHLDHDETNHDVKDERLAALCQCCHLRYDVEEKKRRRKVKKKQLELFKF